MKKSITSVKPLILFILVQVIGFLPAGILAGSKYAIHSDSKPIPDSDAIQVNSDAKYPDSVDKLWELLNQTEGFKEYIPRVTQSESLGSVGGKDL